MSKALPPILLVDDDTEFREVFAQKIAGWGYQVETAVDGRDALEKIDDTEQDWLALITDFNMPNLNGADLIRAVNIRGLPFFAVVLFSQLNIKENEIAMLRSDFADETIFCQMNKPIPTDALKELLLKAAERARRKQ